MTRLPTRSCSLRPLVCARAERQLVDRRPVLDHVDLLGWYSELFERRQKTVGDDRHRIALQQERALERDEPISDRRSQPPRAPFEHPPGADAQQILLPKDETRTEPLRLRQKALLGEKGRVRRQDDIGPEFTDAAAHLHAVLAFLSQPRERRVPREFTRQRDALDSKPRVAVDLDGSLSGSKGPAVQVQDVHAAACELPAQLNLERMSHVVMDDHARRWLPRSFTGIRVLARNVSHAASVPHPPQAHRPQFRSSRGPIESHSRGG